MYTVQCKKLHCHIIQSSPLDSLLLSVGFDEYTVTISCRIFSLPHLQSQRFPPICSSNYFIALASSSKSLSHLKLTLMYNVRYESKFSLFYTDIQLIQHNLLRFVKKISPMNYTGDFIKNHLYICGSIYGLSFLPISLSVYFNANITDVITVLYGKSQNQVEQVLQICSSSILFCLC